MKAKPSSRRFGSINVLFAFLLVGCAGMSRSCSSCNAESFGADWIVVQTDLSGHPFRCWELANTSIANETSSDGIYWTEGSSGNLVHISGLYNRVQVTNGNWNQAYAELGLTKATCAQVRELRYDPRLGTYWLPRLKTSSNNELSEEEQKAFCRDATTKTLVEACRAAGLRD